MVICAVAKCSNRTSKDRADNKKGVRFFNIPKVITNQCSLTRSRTEKRRATWISRINRKDLQDADVKPYTRVCSVHFISGEPARLWDETNPDWAPSLNLGYTASSSCTSFARYDRAKVRAEKRKSTTSTIAPSPSSTQEDEELAAPSVVAEQLHEDFPVVSEAEALTENVDKDEDMEIQFDATLEPEHGPLSESESVSEMVDYAKMKADYQSLEKKYSELCKEHAEVRKWGRSLRDQVTNLEVDKFELKAALKSAEASAVADAKASAKRLKAKEIELTDQCDDRVAQLTEHYTGLVEEQTKIAEDLQEKMSKIERCTFSSLEAFTGDEEKVIYYTGLPSSEMFQTILNTLVEYITDNSLKMWRCVLEHWQSLLLTLMRLRLSLSLQDLAYRFCVSESTACRTFEKWIDLMYVTLYPAMVKWPNCETLWETMPRIFKESYGNSMAVIIDCFEIFTDKPSSLETRAMVWSNYKHHHTAKVLIGISPTGSIIFVSTTWGARVSDKQIVSESGLYELLLPHDVVLADRGFNIAEHLALHNAKLLIPAFTRGCDQLNSHDVSLTRKIANLCIHVERVIGLVRRKYRILKSRLHVEMLTVKPGQEYAPIDKIVRVCCALTNLCTSVVIQPEMPE